MAYSQGESKKIGKKNFFSKFAKITNLKQFDFWTPLIMGQDNGLLPHKFGGSIRIRSLGIGPPVFGLNSI